MCAKPLAGRLAIVAVMLSLATSACIFGGGGASGVKPPPKADATLTGRVGVVIATNTPSLRRHADSRGDKGVVVLFVQPGGPADRAGIEQGDVITEIDGEPSTNAEYGVVQLRSENGADRRLAVVRKNGDKREVRVRARIPGNVDLIDLYDPLIDRDPDDALLRYLRAQAQPASRFDEAIDDLDRALDIDDKFVEAMILRGEKSWGRSRQLQNDDRRESELLSDALNDWRAALETEGENTRALTNVAQSSALLNQAAPARRAAGRALELDERLPTAYYALGQAELVSRNYAEAAKSARSAIDLNPFDVRYYELLGQAFKRLDRVDDCEETMQSIIGLLSAAQDRARMLRICL